MRYSRKAGPDVIYRLFCIFSTNLREICSRLLLTKILYMVAESMIKVSKILIGRIAEMLKDLYHFVNVINSKSLELFVDTDLVWA